MLTGLRDPDEVPVGENGRDSIHLNRCGGGVKAQVNVLSHDGVQASVIPL